MFALAVPLAATAGDGNGKSAGSGGGSSYVSPGLLKKAEGNPGAKIDVIIQSSAGTDAAEQASKGLGSLRKRLGLIGAVAVELPAAKIAQLQKVPGLIITEDAPVKKASYSSTQLWPHENGVAKLWNGPKAPTIAFVDSGIDTSKLDFAGRKVTSVSINTTGTSGDDRGHGTFVAGIAAGSAPGFAGAAPNADIVMLDVMDGTGSGKTSDVIEAAGWIYANKDAYGIRVANFSLHAGGVVPFHQHPLNRAVEKLWFSGVVVVAAAGNYGKPDGPSGVMHAPGNDPFVITVGAMDLGGTHRIGDDARAPWSAYGRTNDGFWKPEICAAGRYMVGPIAVGSTLAKEKADKLVNGGGYIELSGTSFAAPVVSGVVAQLLARHPSLTPDQVKATLMARARAVPQAAPGSCGVGQINAARAGTLPKNAANPNLALNRFVMQGTDGPVFDNVSWTDVSWADVSWDSVSWTDVSWADVSWADNAEGDAGTGTGYELTPAEAAEAAADPELLLPGEQPVSTTTSTTSVTSGLG